MASVYCDRLTVAWVMDGRGRNLKEVGWREYLYRSYAYLSVEMAVWGSRGRG